MLQLYPNYEFSSETVDLDEIGGVEDRILCEDNHSFVPIKNYDVKPGIDANDNESRDDENEEDDDEADVKNNDSTLDDGDGGIIMNDGTIEYDEFNIPIIVVHLRIGGRYAVFGFYRQLVRPFKQGRKKLGIICVICDKALDGTNDDQWTWVNFTMFITKKNH